MELRLTVQPPVGRTRDLIIEVEPTAPVSALIDALAQDAGLRAHEIAGALVDRLGRLEPDGPVGSAGLCDGDILALLAADPDASTYRPGAGRNGAATAELVVVGGPEMGTRVALSPGPHVVGRGPGADVVIADGSLSRRHLQVSVADDGIELRDLGSSNGTFVEGRAVREPRRLAAADTVEAGRSLLVVRPRQSSSDRRRADGQGGVPFNRPPRIAQQQMPAAVAVAAPPTRHESARFPLGAILLPPLLAVVMFVVTKSPMMLAIGILGPGMAIYNWWDGRRTSRRSHGDQAAAFERSVADAAEQISSAREEEAARRRAQAPSADQLLERAERLDRALWERRPDDHDFLVLRLGVTDQPSALAAAVERGGDPELRAQAEERLAERAMLPALPVTAPGGALGLAGPAERTAALARWLVGQAAVLHSPAELEIAAALTRRRARHWDWMKWLPHVADGDLAAGEDAAGRLLASLDGRRGRPLLLLLDAELALDRATIAGAFRDGVHVLWLGDTVAGVPGDCRTIAELAEDVAALKLTRAETGEVFEDVVADGVGIDWAERLARLLAPVRDAAAREAAAQIPVAVSLLDLLRIADPTPVTIARAWREHPHDRSLEAPLGMTAAGPFTVDPARSDGMRMLIGGMPGAGKSELLQSLVASLAALHPPDRLAFLLVDYKGGAAFRDCVELPHVVGLVTDLDARLADRARVSLLAELRRRETILADAGARNLGELTRRDPAGAPPATLIVVDEFAALVREVPAFVDTLVDVAQRGRSLGLHLVLATQRPRGVVNDTIRANTNLRIAMRMSDGAESGDVIEAPDAAEIPAGLPGRALALTGRGPGGTPELTAFQAAYAGGRSGGIVETEVRVSDFAFGAPRVRQERVLSLAGTQAGTDLQAIVASAAAAASELEIAPPPSPWLPPLPPAVTLSALKPAGSADAAAIGLIDDPARQRQVSWALDLERDGGLLVYGTSGSGKTTLLRTLAASLAQSAPPGEVQIYALDFASRGLHGLDALPHCGSVIAGEESERVLRLLDGLHRDVRARSAALGDVGASGLADYRRRAGRPLPRIVLLLDGYPAFAANYERVAFGDPLNALHRLAAEGRAVGIHVVVTADRRAGVPGALAGVVPGRVVLRLADEDDYPALGVPKALVAGTELPPGRGFTRDGAEVQIAVFGEDPSEQVAALAALGRRLTDAYPGQEAPRIGVLPSRVPCDRLPAPPADLVAVVGVGNDRLQPVVADLREDHFLVAGPVRSGRSTALGTIVTSLRRARPDLDAHLLAPRRSTLPAAGSWTSVAEGPDACRVRADELLRLLERPAGAPVVLVVVDDGGELSELMALETIVRRGRDGGVRLLAAVETHAAARAFGGWLREIRSVRRGLLLAPDPETDGDLLGVRLPRSSPVPPAPGRGYLVGAGAAELIQTGTA